MAQMFSGQGKYFEKLSFHYILVAKSAALSFVVIHGVRSPSSRGAVAVPAGPADVWDVLSAVLQPLQNRN